MLPLVSFTKGVYNKKKMDGKFLPSKMHARFLNCEVPAMSNIRYELLDTGPAAHGSPQLLYVTSAQYGRTAGLYARAHLHRAVLLRARHWRVPPDRPRPAVGSDDLIIVNPHVEHTETSFSSNPLEYIVLGVNGLDLQLAGEPSPLQC